MLIQVKGLTKTFGGLTAVNSVDFEIEKGKVTAIIGPNGAGKSTFFNLISGFHQPSSGSVMFDSTDITSLKAHQIAKLGIARTFQTTNLFEQSTVLDNVLIGHRLRTSSGLFDAIFRTSRMKREEKESLEKAHEVLEFVGLTNLANKHVSEISQEEMKRTAFALALATDPVIVFLDEPAAGVNPEETDGLAELIKKMVSKGISVCLIEHKMQMIMNLADKIMVLNYGQKIAEGTPEEIKKNPAVIEAYLGGEAVAQAY
ncbi:MULTISPECIES: ABC transporter ATP-binding protein [Bacillaceae]|uniref:ABC transporter ATP-binding protein n=1 Tax=Bacillaceae TaxID=186817 RepID=UPI000BFC16B0|nr:MULTISPECIES: ABC transporter ATP-binding protein [Bacillaceae]PGT91584.1 high-affinity branched-chain amino acid ABC transporter ATP-binding protein LivG [Bacillus sp. AFS040349]UGB28998.1 ABC transporter ATP-binding protein [Metabacillus sp. B2-18]